MALIEKKDPVVLNIKLTSKGREQLSKGNLTFKYFAIGDSEIDYNYVNDVNEVLEAEYTPLNISILRPVDKNPQIISFIPKNINGNNYNLTTPSIIPYNIVNCAKTLGFFIESGSTFITDSIHVKQPDLMTYMSSVVGGTSISLYKAPTFGESILEPEIGDLLLIKFTLSGNTTTGHTINKNLPTPYLFYKIVNKTGSLNTNNIIVEVDRELPDYSSYPPLTGIAGVMIYYSDYNSIYQYSSNYSNESVESFLANYQYNREVIPFWNMSIIFTEEIAGISGNSRNYGQFDSNTYGGFVSYIQNQAPVYKKLGVIHYTNSSPTNQYAEEFYLTTPKLVLPTLMWHKSSTTTLGLTLVATGSSKILTGSTKSLNIQYYNLADENGNIVGKVFNTLKIFVIEDQELLFAMSYKSNRSWTLPNYNINAVGGTAPCPDCPDCPE